MHTTWNQLRRTLSHTRERDRELLLHMAGGFESHPAPPIYLRVFNDLLVASLAPVAAFFGRSPIQPSYFLSSSKFPGRLPMHGEYRGPLRLSLR